MHLMPLHGDKFNSSGRTLEVSLQQLSTQDSEVIYSFHNSAEFKITEGSDAMNQKY